ncbi:MAG TPA: 4'-phosphopantetheinyl transferase superfamily protein [Solirubrobacteraceae bacterium]|jgi:4'-phosphopantetheinyl transferase EntD|nr:4'-phosphopantetheinyl transferase superfamily protein [Solirubrobacteraceae bacterium]
MADALAAIVPPGVVVVERGWVAAREGPDADGLPPLHPVEEELIAGASQRRRREFAEARDCAREALRSLGAPAQAIPAGPDGAPVWPQGVVGSITHKGSYCAAAVARSAQLAGLGIDAEPDEPMPAGVLETVASPRELEQVEALLARRPGVAWDRLLFAAKEAALKAAHPFSAPQGVRGVEVELDAVAGSFTAVAGARLGVPAAPEIHGTWATSHGRILAVASVPPEAVGRA